MKHKVIIRLVNGNIESIHTSGDTEIFLIEKDPLKRSLSKLEPDFIFENGKAHELYEGRESEFLKKHNV